MIVTVEMRQTLRRYSYYTFYSLEATKSRVLPGTHEKTKLFLGPRANLRIETPGALWDPGHMETHTWIGAPLELGLWSLDSDSSLWVPRSR